MTGDEEAPEELLEAARIRRDFLAHMRHELRTPLNAIIGYGEMLLEDAAEQGRRAFIPDLEKIRVSGQQLLVLVNDILAPAKMRAGEAKLDLETFRANLRHELRTPLNAIIGYSEMLLEDAAEQGQQGFIADLLQIHTAGERLLALTDDLINLSKTEADKISPGSNVSGVSGGIRDVASTVRPPNENRVGRPKAERGFLLVVDDSEVNRDILSRRLEREGHTVAVAESGAEALQMMRAQKFDLVLLDVMMPEMDGHEVLEHLRGNEAWRDIPVIMISALDELDSIVRCIEMGAEDYLPKPFNTVLLRARIGACLEKKRLREAQLLQQKAEEERLMCELEMAAKVQQRLFPERPPEVAGLELAGICYPARVVGGDYYDFLVLDRGQIGIAIADVSGKAMPAALLMSTVEASLRSQVRSTHGCLTELVASLNNLLHSWTSAGNYVTFFYAQFSEEQRLLTYVNAGHNPPMLMRPGTAQGPGQASGRVRSHSVVGAVGEGAGGGWTEDKSVHAFTRLLTTGGPVLGAFKGFTYEQETIQLQSGDVLVAYTDGVTEALDPEQEQFGESRLQAVMGAGAHLSAEELMGNIVAGVREWSRDVPQFDDMTVVVLKVK